MPKPTLTAPPAPKPSEPIVQLLDEWQNRLRLQDWDITVEYLPYQRVEAFGLARTNLSQRVSIIELVPQDQLQHETLVDDIEVTLVHELLHVKSADALETASGATKPEIDGPLWECFIEHVAQALVAAKRGQQRVR